MSATTTGRTPTELRALELLGTGSLSIEMVAAACGVTPARISQLLSDAEFSEEVSARRFQNLQKHNKRDTNYDDIEDGLIDQFRQVMPMMMRPAEILKGIQVINAAKRRGISSPDTSSAQGTVVTINMPTKVVQHFTTNIHNQVIQAGSQDLITMQSSAIDKLAAMNTDIKTKLIGTQDGNYTEHSGPEKEPSNK